MFYMYKIYTYIIYYIYVVLTLSLISVLKWNFHDLFNEYGKQVKSHAGDYKIWGSFFPKLLKMNAFWNNISLTGK